MTRLIQIDSGRIRVRRPDGYVGLDTDGPMPAVIGTLALNDITVNFPKTGYEKLVAVSSSGVDSVYTSITGHDTTIIKDLGAFTGSKVPTVLFGRARLRQTLGGGNVTGVQEAPLATNEWMAWPGGSMLVEIMGQGLATTTTGATFLSGPCLIRTIDLQVAAGRWRLNLRQSCPTYRTAAVRKNDTITTSTASTFKLDLNIAWGVWA